VEEAELISRIDLTPDSEREMATQESICNTRRVRLLVVGLLDEDFESERYSVTRVTSASTAVSVMDCECPDVLVIDVNIPSAWIVMRFVAGRLTRHPVAVIAVVRSSSLAARQHAVSLSAAAIVSDTRIRTLSEALHLLDRRLQLRSDVPMLS
jgi:DNA-binding response OmpR family regulator